MFHKQLPRIEDAVHHGDLEAVKESIEVGFDKTGWQKESSLLIVAIEKGYNDIALALLAAQRLNVDDLCTALDTAHDKGMEKVAEEIINQLMFIVEAGAICKELSQEQNNRLFQLACRKGDASAVHNLLKSGCDICTLSRDEQEHLLHLAFDKSNRFVGDMFVIETLLQTVAVSSLSKEEQEELLLQACSEGNLTVANTLITNGCNVNCTNFQRCTPLMISVRKSHEKIVKTLILAGAMVEMQDSNGFTALHHAASCNHTQCGILLAEGGASVRTKNRLFQTPLDIATTGFYEAIMQALSFTIRKTVCIIGNAESGKSTLIAALQAKSNYVLGKIFNRFRRVDDIRKRTAGIEPISHASQRYGEVLFFDFAGQHEYHGPHQMFLESLLSKPGVSMTLLVVVKATEEEEAILHQLHRWLTPVALMATAASPPQVIVIGSFLDKVKSKHEAIAKLSRSIEAIKSDLEDSPLEIVGSCFLNCRRPQSEGIDQLCMYLEEIPVPELRATHTQYSLAWVLSQIRLSFKAQAVQLQEFSKWIQDNRPNLPQTMPPPEEVCQDLSAAGHALYLPNKEDTPKGWLVLDLPRILRDVYGTLFSQSKDITNEVGLVHLQHLAELFQYQLDVEFIQQLLVGLEFCIPLDPSVLKVDVSQLAQSQNRNEWLFFPALISAKPPQPTSESLPQQGARYLCWQLRTSIKHSISAHVLQTILLRLAAHFVVEQHEIDCVQQHCCSIWWNGIAWQSRIGVDVIVQITNNRVIQVVSASDISADKSFRYLSNVISDILSVVRQLPPNFAAAAYIVHPWEMTALHEDTTATPPKELFPVEDIRNSIADHRGFTLSLKSPVGHASRLPVSELFGGWNPSLEDIERILWTRSKSSQSAQNLVSINLPPNTSTDPTATPAVTATDHPANLPPTPAALPVDTQPTPTPALQPSLSIPSGAQALLDTSAVPTLNDVNQLLVTQVAAKWQNLAIKLGVKDFIIDAISKNNRHDCEQACQDMLKRWLREERHTGGEERTWSTLLTALGRADFGELERSLWRENFHK